MACVDQVLKERRVNEPLFQRGAKAMAGKSAATISKILPPGKKKDMAASSVKAVDMEKMRKALVVVVEALEAKMNGSCGYDGEEALGKEKRSVKALVLALVALFKAEKRAVEFQKLLDEVEWVDSEDGEVDEEHLKLVAEMEDELLHMWDGDWRSGISREACHVFA